MRSCCRPWAWCRTACRCSAAARWSAMRCRARDGGDHGPGLRRLGASHVRDGPAGLALSFFCAASILIAVPSAVAVFAWIATIWLGRPVITTAVPVLRRLHHAVRHRRRLGVHDRERAGRLATHRHLFRRRPPALRADRHQRLSGASAPSTLVPEVDRAACWTSGSAAGTSGSMFIGFNLAFLPMHLTGLLGHAAADLHLSR